MTPRRMLSEMTVHDLYEQMALSQINHEDRLQHELELQAAAGLKKK